MALIIGILDLEFENSHVLFCNYCRGRDKDCECSLL